MRRRTVLSAAAALLASACLGPSPERVAEQPVAPTATPPSLPTATPTGPPAPRRTPVIAPLYLPPTRLRIPRIGVDARVQEVGLDAAGELTVPTSGDYVVWYGASAPPGLPGNAIFAGHVDWSGRLAVFGRLRELAIDDAIETVASDGATHRFLVRATWTFSTAAAPVAEVFGPTAHPTVTLITCGGVFDQRTRDYSLRIVVRGEANGRVGDGSDHQGGR